MINLSACRMTFFLTSCFFCFSFLASAQSGISSSSLQTENFNSLSTAFPLNWKVSSPGTGLTSGWATVTNGTVTTQSANNGTPTSGGVYNWGTTSGSDRALGFMTSSTYASPNAIMAWYRNTSGATQNIITVSFQIERYRINMDAFTLSFFSSTDGSAWTAQASGDVANSIFPIGSSGYSFSTPKTITKTISVNIAAGLPNNADFYLKWVFTTGTNSQGLGLDNVSVFAGAATPVMIANLRDILQVDNGTPNQFNEGDVIRYQTVVKNVGTGDANNVQITLPTPPANTTMVAGSIKTSALAIDDNYSASFNTTLNASSVLTNDIGIPTPTAVITYGPTNNLTINPGTATTTDAGGAITLAANGTFVYTAPTGFSGVDKFKYITGNGNLPNNDAVVTITVAPDITFTTTNVDPSCNGGSNGSITFNASGGNGALQYSINGSGGPFQASTTFSGLAAGTFNLAVKDAGGYIKTGTATLTNPPLVVVLGTIPTLTYLASMSPITFTKTGGTGSITWSASGLPSGVNINASTGQVSGTPTVTGIFNAVITATDANGCTGTKSQSVNVAPNLGNDSYTQVVGNTQLVVDGHSTPTTPFTSSITNILTNDGSNAAITVTAGTFATTGGGSITIASDGKFIYTPPVGITATDSYTYTATSNTVSATATISFTIANMVWYVKAGGAAGDGRSNTPLNTLPNGTIGSTGHYIYVQKEVSGTTPGSITLQASQQLIGAGANLSIGVLSVTGSAGNTPTLTNTVTLANSVNATGFNMNNGANTAFTNAGTTVTGVMVNVGSVTTTTGLGINLTGTGNSVTFTFTSLTTNGAANAVTLTNTAGTVTINGGTLTGGTGAVVNISGGTVGFTYSGSASQATAAQPLVNIAGGHATGTVLFQTGTLNATNGTGLQFDNADGTYNFNGTTTLNGGDAGIDILNGSAGTFNFPSGIAITNPTNEAIRINASTANITYSGTFSKTNVGTGILVNGETGGTITINGTGTKTFSTSTGNAINLTSNTGATINFSGNNLSLTTTSGTGFNATGGGTISVTGSGNTITSTTGVALNVGNTVIGATGLTFQSISANGGPNGIVLNATGAGGLTVTGTTTVDGTGGTIQNITTRGIFLTSASNVTLKNMKLISANNSVDGGMAGTCDDLTIGGCNAAIYLSSVSTITMDNVDLSGTMVENGITGLNVSALTMNNCTITGAGNEPHEKSVRFLNLSGTCSVNNCDFSFPATDNFDVINDDVNVTLTVSGTTFRDSQTLPGGGSNINGEGGFRFRIFSRANLTDAVPVSTAAVPVNNVKIDNCSFLRLSTQGVQAFSSDDAKLNIDIKNSTIDCGTDVGTGIDINANNDSKLYFNILNNPLIKSRGGAAINITSFINGWIEGTVDGNGGTSGPAGIVTDLAGIPIRILPQENSHAVVKVSNNRIAQAATGTENTGIDVQARFQTAKADVTISNNQIALTAGQTADINLTAGSSASGETSIVCAHVLNNAATGAGTTRAFRVRVSDLDGTSDPRVYLQGFVEAGTSLQDVEATWNSKGNTPTSSGGSEVAYSSTLSPGNPTAPSAPPGGTCLVPTNPLLASTNPIIIPIERQGLNWVAINSKTSTPKATTLINNQHN